MIVRVLGCSGSIAAGCKTTSFLLDDDILIDAGTGVGDLTLDAMARIDHIFVSHSHLDHILSIPLLADSVMRVRRDARKEPIQVYALSETLAALREHVFNGVIWPDFTRLPTSQNPVLALVQIEVGEIVVIGGKRVEVLSAAHTVPAVGFAVDDGAGAWWVYTGDTGPNDALWAQLKGRLVSHLVIETAFGDEEAELARISRHLSPASLGQELRKLHGRVNVFVTHIKPGETAAVMDQVNALGSAHRVIALTAGERMEIGVENSFGSPRQADGPTSVDGASPLLSPA